MPNDRRNQGKPTNMQASISERSSEAPAETQPTARRIVVRPKAVVSAKPEGRRQKAMMALVPVLAITLVVLMKRPFGAPRSAPAREASRPPSVVSPSVDLEVDWQIPPVYDPTLRDPMRLTVPREKVGSEPVPVQDLTPHVDVTVRGIVYSDEEPTAIINTQVVHEGDLVSGATVTKIHPDAVEFMMNGRRWRQVVETRN